MFIREKVIKKGNRTYSYYQLVQGTRVDGKVRQTVVKHLGPWGDREAATGYAKQAGYLCGAKDCTNEPTVSKDAIFYGGRGRRPSKPNGTLYVCEGCALRLEAGGGMDAFPFAPAKMDALREVIRTTGRGGRPKVELQDRDSAMQTTDWDAD